MLKRISLAVLALLWMSPAQAATTLSLSVPFSLYPGSGVLVGEDANGDGWLTSQEFSLVSWTANPTYAGDIASMGLGYVSYMSSPAVTGSGGYWSSFAPVDFSILEAGDTISITVAMLVGFVDNRGLPRGSATYSQSVLATVAGTVAPVPLPASAALLAGGLAALGLRGRRQG